MSVRPLPHLLALLAGAAAAVAVGCGDRSNLIPPSDAAQLKNRLADVRAAVEAGDCPAAQAALDRAQAAANLPTSVDRRLRMRINQGIRELKVRVPEDCQAARTQPTTTAPPTTTTAPPTTTTAPTTTTTPPATTTPPTTTTPPATTPSQTTTTPPDTGGVSPETGATP